MDKQKLISFFFDFTGMDFDKLLEGLGIDEKLERRKIQNVVNDFEKYIFERHGENPSYDGISKVWKENQVFEKIIKIRYTLNSEYKGYEEFKSHLKTMISSQDFDLVLFFELMDELNKLLIEEVKKASNFTIADIATMNHLIEANQVVNSNSQNKEVSGGGENQNFDNKQVEVNSKDKPIPHLASSIFFENRFYESFPDCDNKNFKVYNDQKVIINRLTNFFEDFNYLEVSPIRKVRGSSYEGISRLKFEDGKILMRIANSTLSYEIKINRLVAFNSPGYWNKFIMIEVDGDVPAKIRGDADDCESNSITKDYAYSDGDYYPITSYNTKRFTENGMLQTIDGELNVRTRFLKKHNFFIVPRFHPLACDQDCYYKAEEILDELLSCCDEMAELIFLKVSNLLKTTKRTYNDSREDRYVYCYR